MDAKHSETPWHYEARGGYIDSEQDRIAMLFPGSFGRENAAFIVRAVNSHAVLAEYFHASKSLQMTMGHPDATVEDKHKAEARYKAATTAARAALAAAEG